MSDRTLNSSICILTERGLVAIKDIDINFISAFGSHVIIACTMKQFSHLPPHQMPSSCFIMKHSTFTQYAITTTRPALLLLLLLNSDSCLMTTEYISSSCSFLDSQLGWTALLSDASISGCLTESVAHIISQGCFQCLDTAVW